MCIDCDTSKQRIWHAFTNNCKGCQARALSRGPHYWESAQKGKQSPGYQQMLHKLGLKHEQVKQAHASDAINSSSLKTMVKDGYKPGCTGKQPFEDWATAEKRARFMRNNHESGCKVEPYKCKVCGKIHIGQARERRKHKEMA